MKEYVLEATSPQEESKTSATEIKLSVHRTRVNSRAMPLSRCKYSGYYTDKGINHKQQDVNRVSVSMHLTVRLSVICTFLRSRNRSQQRDGQGTVGWTYRPSGTLWL